jgi:nitroreductase
MQPDEMRVVAEFASLAPSVHNTQPWRFVAREGAIGVYADFTRELGYLDPSGRQLNISCGAAVEFARLAVRAVGYDVDVDLRPQPSDPTLVATIHPGGRVGPDAAEQRLIEAATRRYTDRGAYSDEPPTAGELDRLRSAAKSFGCWCRVLDRPEDRLTAVTLLADAESMENADPEYRAELESWQRETRSEDGIPATAHSAWAEGRVSDVPLRDFTGHDRHPHPHDGEPPAVERDTIILIGTETDDEYSWLCAGRALAAVLLTLTDANLVSQPLGPVLDVPATRARLRHDLGLVGQPQFMLRIGHGTGRPQTGRRSVNDLLTVDRS